MSINAHTSLVTDYGPDPDTPGRAIVREAMLRLHGWTTGVFAGGDVDPEGQFGGVLTHSLQDFKGLAAPTASPVAYRNGDYATIDSAATAGPGGNPTMRVFADRLRRRRA